MIQTIAIITLTTGNHVMTRKEMDLIVFTRHLDEVHCKFMFFTIQLSNFIYSRFTADLVDIKHQQLQ